EAHAVAAALRGGRLQLPAPGPLRRRGLPAAAHVFPEPARGGLRGRRLPAGRAAAARTVEGRGDRHRAGRDRDLPPPPSPAPGPAGLVPRVDAPRREPATARRALHARHHLPRREVADLLDLGAPTWPPSPRSLVVPRLRRGAPRCQPPNTAWPARSQVQSTRAKPAARSQRNCSSKREGWSIASGVPR